MSVFETLGKALFARQLKGQSATVTGTGPMFTVTRSLGSASTLALISGSSGNLSINSTTGVISATAAIGSGVTQRAIVREANAATAIAQEYPVDLTGAVVSTPLTISGTQGAATVGQAYSFTPAVSGGSGTKTFALTGTLPGGLSFSTSTGVISGTPNATGTTSGISITVTDASGAASLSGLSIAVGAAAATLTLTGPLTYAASAAAGTLVANIGNVPAGQAPTISPNDGRLVVAGDATNGWKVVVGLSASSIGTIALSVSATGATTGTATVTVTAAAGAAPTAPSGLAPSIQYHPNTSALTMRADSTFSGYIVPATGANASTLSVLVVTAWSATSSQALKYGITLTAGGAAAGTMIISHNANATTPPPGGGGTGSYFVTGAGQTVGSAGSPVTFTAAAQQVIGMSDLKGRAPLSSADNKGPELKTDGYGRKFLHFSGEASAFEWLRNITVTGLDTHNIAWFLVGRFPTAGKTSQLLTNTTLVSTGAFEAGGVPAQTTALGLSLNFPTNAVGGTVSTATPIATAKRMMTGSQMQVVGSSTATTDGVGGTAVSATGRTWLNETSYSSTSGPARGNNVTGLTINARALASGPNLQAGFDLYELNGYVLGELGTPSTSQARGDAIVAAMMSNWNIPPIARQFVLLGDSRTEYGLASVGASPNEGTGITISSLLTDPGPNALPADVRVTSWAAGGQGVGFMNGYLDQTMSNFATAPSPLSATWMLGGGKDYFSILSGTNEPGLWPSTDNNARGGVAGSASNAFVDDYYNGPGYTTTFSATVSAGSQSVAAASISPSFVYSGMTFSGTGWAPGAYSSGYYTTTPFALGFQQPTALSGVATTGFLGSYQSIVGKLLARGFKGTWLAEWSHVNAYFNSKVVTSALADAQAGPSQTYAGKLSIADPSQITVNGKYLFGNDFSGYGFYQIDFIHMTTFGKMALVSGGDTPQYGYAASVKSILAT